MPRIHTGAVIWYSGTPTRLPFKSSGRRMPLFAETKMHEWRKKRDGNTGIAMNGGAGALSDALYEESDISEASNSRSRIMRKNVSSTGSVRYVSSMPSARTVPSASARVRSYSQQAKLRRSLFTGPVYSAPSRRRHAFHPAVGTACRRVRGARAVSVSRHQGRRPVCRGRAARHDDARGDAQ